MSLIKLKISCFAGNDDLFIVLKDREALELEMARHGVNFTLHKYDVCGHLTFLWGKKESKRIFTDIEEEILVFKTQKREL